MLFYKNSRPIAYVNSLDAWVPELWAQETLAILEEQMVIGSRVNRDFSPQIQSQGDIVNTRRPNQYEAERKGANDNVTVQDSSATSVAIPLDQLIHTSFVIKDLEQALAMDDLVRVYLRPAAISIARQIDKILLNQVYQFRASRSPAKHQVVGHLNGLAVANVKERIISTFTQMRENRAPEDQVWDMYISPKTQGTMLNLDLFNAADKIGDDGTQLRKASLGELLGFNMIAPQNMPFVEVAAGTTDVDELLTTAAKGDTVITVDAAGGLNFDEGAFITFPGVDEAAYKVIDITVDAITLDQPLRFDLPGTTDILRVTHATVNQAVAPTGYAADYDKSIVIDAGPIPVVGQLVSFAGHAAMYGIIKTNGTTTVTLDRPLEAAVADGEIMGLGPAGGYNLAMHRDAMTMVIRPLEAVTRGVVGGGVASFNDLSLRTTITYDGNAQHFLVTLDTLMGVEPLDFNYAVPLLS